MAIRGESDNGEIVFYYYAPVENLVIDSDNILTTTMLFAMSMCMVVVILSFWFSSKLSKPLKKLVDTFNVVESGNFDIKLENNNRDEIGDLTRKFMHMLNRLKTAIEENNEAHKNAKEAELRALQAQINPHFLYNTLSIINWRAIEFGADELSDIVLTLSTFYRTALNRGSDEITLGEEIVNVKAYTDIRLSMSNNGFDVEYDIDETLLQCRVIKLILQPIVENALDHGIKELSTGRGKIIIRASKNGNELLLEVSDNGEGMSRELADDIISGTAKGYGLKNVNDRLKVKFGNQCGLRIESKKGLGTTVYIEGIRIE
ncbi:MAG: sensor histidine kinase [Clostridiales bacterium]|nr:sensor histidine kinase [Clostridiales bacterium]